MAVWILIGALLAVAVLALGAYYGLKTLRVRVETAWADLDGQLQRRCALVLDLIEAAGARLPHPPALLQELAAARQAALDAHAIPERYEAENRLTEALRRLFTLADIEPELRRDAALLSGEEALAATETEIAAACRSYNDRVMALNVRRHRFPWRVMAFRFSPAEYFIIDDPAHR